MIQHIKRLSELQQRLLKKKDLAILNEYEDYIKTKAQIVLKYDKKPHLACFLEIGNDKNGDINISSINLTSKDSINYDNGVIMSSENKYNLIDNDKVVQKSYETSIVLETITKKQYNNFDTPLCPKIDIRCLISDSFYPDILLHKLTSKKLNNLYLDKTNGDIEIEKIYNDSILNSIVRKNLLISGVVDSFISEYNDINCNINFKLNYNELLARKYLNYQSNLFKKNKSLYIEKDKNSEIFNMLKITDIEQNEDLSNFMKHEYNAMEQLCENILKKF